MANFVSGVGPLFGPDFVMVAVNDENGTPFQVQVYPDAHNPQLKAAGLPTQYYFQPARIRLAKRHDSPQDYDFQMTLFKGLADSEDSIVPAEMEGTELGGGYCAFSTTFGLPPNIVDQIRQKLKTRDHGDPGPRLGPFFNFQQNDPTPEVGIVPIVDSTITCAIPDPAVLGNMFKASAQHAGKGSIEAQGLTSFLVSANVVQAGAIASAMKDGVSPPFTIFNTLKESFYINNVTVNVHVDEDKVYDSFSASVSTGSLFGIDSFEWDTAYSNCVTSGAITTTITMNDTALPENDPIKKWITDKVDSMRQMAVDLVKKEIFDWDPAANDSKASADRGWWSSIFGGSKVSLKSTHERKHVVHDDTLILDQTISVTQTVSGNLNDLMDKLPEELGKYLAVVDIFEFFKKIQVCAQNTISFIEANADQGILPDPVVSGQIQAGYPDFNDPVVNGAVNLNFKGNGGHFPPGSSEAVGPPSPAIWTKTNAQDLVNIEFLRLDNAPPEWPENRVNLKYKLVFDSRDPRVKLTKAIAPNDPAIAEWEEITTDLKPKLTASRVGGVFVRFLLPITPIPKGVTLTFTATIGGDTYPPIIANSNKWKNVIWEVWSDKYLDETEFSYTIKAQVNGPGFFDPPVVWSSAQPEKVSVTKTLRMVADISVVLPEVPADKLETVNKYIQANNGAV